MVKPGRPLGLSIAIIVSVMLFSILPFAQVVFVMSLQQQFANIDFMEQGGAVGGELQISSINLIAPAIMGIIFFVVAVLAWRGRPHAIRLIFVLAVILITAVTIGLTAAALGTSPTLEQGLDSGADFSNSLLMTRAVFSILVALYVIWYVNRGPARAFYRGYYLQEPNAQPI
jgi:uncharacterized membrane protein (UPF0136 family)